ncbi:uncharacterized protein LOC144115893 isoform X4 [Amblyomma americanum]
MQFLKHNSSTLCDEMVVSLLLEHVWMSTSCFHSLCKLCFEVFPFKQPPESFSYDKHSDCVKGFSILSAFSVMAFNPALSLTLCRSCFEFLEELLHMMPTHTLERHIAILQEAIKKGISDADPEARAFSRKAFWGFSDHFKEQADVLLNSLDTSKQRMFQGELCMSNSSFSNSLNSAQGRPMKHSVSSHGSMENRSRPGSGTSTLVRRPGVRVYNTRSASVRPSSAIDLGTARRARSRAFSTTQNRGTGASLHMVPLLSRKFGVVVTFFRFALPPTCL